MQPGATSVLAGTAHSSCQTCPAMALEPAAGGAPSIGGATSRGGRWTSIQGPPLALGVKNDQVSEVGPSVPSGRIVLTRQK
jgi:hypothetical protein